MEGGKPAAGSAEKAAPSSGTETKEKPADKAGSGKAPFKFKRPAANRRNLLRAGIVALALLAGLLGWLGTRDSGGSSAPAEAGARIVSEAELAEAAATLGQPVYWAGARPGTELELIERGEGGGVQVAYLPEGTDPETASAKVLTIGTYPLADPATELEGFAARPGAIVRHSADGREVVSSESAPSSVYFVSPDNSVQVEVYNPSPQRAMNLALSGRVQPVG
jgi:hypothetical protein